MKEKTVENLEKYVVKDVSGAALSPHVLVLLVLVTHVVEKRRNEMILTIQCLMCL